MNRLGYDLDYLMELSTTCLSSGRLLEAMRDYSGLSLSALTGGAAGSAIYNDYYRVRRAEHPNGVTISGSYLEKIALILRDKDGFDPDKFLLVTKRYTSMLVRELSAKSRSFVRIYRGNENIEPEFILAEKGTITREQELEQLFHIKDFAQLLKGVRKYFILTLDDVQKVSNPNASENSRFAFSWERTNKYFVLIKQEYLDRLIEHCRSLITDSGLSKREHRLLDVLRDKWVERAKFQIASSYKRLPDQTSNKLYPYMAYLAIEAGYSTTEVAQACGIQIINNAGRCASIRPDALIKFMELLEKPKHPIGRAINAHEFERLLELVYINKKKPLNFRELVKESCEVKHISSGWPR